MRTTINIPDQIIEQLMSFSNAITKTEAVNQAIIDWVKYQKIQKLKSLRGKVNIEDNLSGLRSLEIDELNELNK